MVLNSVPSMEDAVILNAYLKDLDASPMTRQRHLVAFNELLQMQCEVLRLLCQFTMQDADIRTELLGDKVALRNLAQILSIVYQGKWRYATLHRYCPLSTKVSGATQPCTDTVHCLPR